MSRTIKAVVLSLMLLFSFSANAFLEIRGHIGYHPVNPEELNKGVANELKAVALLGFGLDAIVTPPLFPVGLGLRYETLSQKLSYGGVDYTYGVDRLALLINKRFIDTVIFLGAIGTFGIYHKSNLKVSSPLISYEYIAESTTSFSAAAEGGIKLGLWLLGAEAGYSYIVASDYKYDGSRPLNNPKGDYSGLYAKVLVGLSF